MTFAAVAPRLNVAIPVADDELKPSPIRRDVLSVSSQLFAQRGYYAVGMADIAAAADISRATLYRYFSTKDMILAELTRAAVIEAEHHAAALKLLTTNGVDAEQFSRWTHDYVRFHRAYSGVIRAWFDGTVAERLSEAAVGDGIASIRGAVAALLKTATLPTGVDPATAQAVFLAILGRMTEPTVPGQSDAHAAEVIVALLGRSLLSQLGAAT
jgi:AcrR family transcriptional regulator